MKSPWRIFCRTLLCPWLCLAALPAAAQQPLHYQHHWPPAERFAVQRAAQERVQEGNARTDPRAGRSADQEEAVPAGQRRERMSAQDRLQLRRDVRNAGRDIYPDRMPGRRNLRRR